MVEVKDWTFVGKVGSSKSLLNRALVVKSFFPDLQVHGESQSDDVLLMEKGLRAFQDGRAIECGHAGTVLRFLALRSARSAGEFYLQGSERLFSRPQEGLLSLLRQLGCEVKMDHRSMTIRSWGWKPSGDAIHVQGEHSSQFASALMLSSWELPQALFVSIRKTMVSRGYWDMTLGLLEQLGMKFEPWAEGLRVFPHQKISTSEVHVECDLSSVFALACVAAISGSATILNFPEQSLQPDRKFLEILGQMNVPYNLKEGRLSVSRSVRRKALDVNLADCPDLFPCLAALCALTPGRSRLYGATQLAFKESQRIKKTAQLLELIGREVEVLEDGLVIHGETESKFSFDRDIEFDPDQDHRMAMAAGVLKKAGFPIRVQTPDVVQKSFPEFWTILGV